MKNCVKCKLEIEENVKFCPECGANQIVIARRVKNVYVKVFVGVGLVVIVGLGVYSFAFNDVSRFKSLIETDVEKAVVLYEEKMMNDIDESSEVRVYIKAQLNSISKDFEDKKIDTITALDKVERYSKITGFSGEAGAVKNMINDLQDSRNAFDEAIKYKAENNYISALLQLKKVSKLDAQYETALKQIDELSQIVKNETISEITKYINEKNIDKANETLLEAKSVLGEDEDFKKLSKSLEQIIVNDLITNQELAVESVEISKSWIGKIACAIVRNKTNKVVKSYSVAYTAYDKDGYPLMIDEGYENLGGATANIQPNETYGDNTGWDLDTNVEAKSIKMVVVDAEYYDGSTWKNPYYEFWKEKYVGKPLE